jgi:RNA recognition motif-containing protein
VRILDPYAIDMILNELTKIQLIRDARTQKSKGLCYVEFGEKDSLTKALALSNQLLMGYPITVQVVPQLAPTASIKYDFPPSSLTPVCLWCS